MNTKKRAQMQQVFTYILTGIVIVAVLGFGVVQIMKIMDTADEIACLDFKKSLEDRIEQSKGYGSIERGDFYVDCDYQKIWFVDVDECKENHYSGDPIIANSCDDGVRQNVFMGNDIAEDSFYVKGLQVSAADGVLEFDLASGSTINLKFRGTGSGMLVMNGD